MKPGLPVQAGATHLRVRPALRLLGSPNDDDQGIVRGIYRAARDSTILMSAAAAGAGHSFKVRFAGTRPAEPLSAQLLVLLPGDWRDTSLYSGAMPQVTATLDDSLHLDLSPAQVGQYPDHSSVIPVSAWVSSDNLLAIARAHVTHVRLANADLLITPSGRRDLRAFYHVALCGEAPRE
jgi:hypothetical protein